MKAALALVLLVGCADEGQRPATHTDLRAAFSYSDDAVKPVGVAATPDGKRYVFEETHGLFELDGANAQLVMGIADMPAPAGYPAVKQPYTDIVAIDNGKFALTAIGDGYALDINARTLNQWFCYFPGDGGGGGAPVSTIQRTDAVTFDTAAKKLWAQPNTLDAAEVYQYGQLASYDSTSGANVDWLAVTPEINAAGMAVLPDTGLVFGQGTQLVRWDAENYKVIPVADLGAFGVRSIQGLAVDAKTDSLLVVDDLGDEMIDIDLASLAQP